ncbi:MAG: chemotaxis protein CheW [Pseudomonadota bacterium]
MTSKPDIPVAVLLPYMPDVAKCERSLRELNLMWRMIEASAKMNCPVEAKAILPTMAATRAGIDQLEEELVTALVSEKTRNVFSDLATKAGYVIDIVVRNLYERTADVGFLATDVELCAFVAGLSTDVAAMRARLRAYRSKYTVYDEIILLDLRGNVLVQIDEATPLEGSHDPLIAQTLASEGHVETFRASDLRPSKAAALIYSRRVCHPTTGVVVGVLCLCFHFEEEMARIFQTHRDALERSIMLLLDASGAVVASADPMWIPVGATVPLQHPDKPAIVMFAGRQYLARTVASAGYQGYPGPPGWQGQAMVPLDVAFGADSNLALAALDPNWKEGLLSHARSFCPPLFDIMNAANMVRRVVWNGQVMTAGQQGDLVRLKTIMDQISETGARSNELFSGSIREMFDTVLASGLREAQCISHLLVDLLDRNLYERADDCRWWALSPQLRALLAGGRTDRADAMRSILDYINGLYTVYTALLVYDADGLIVAQTGNGGETAIDPASLAQVLALASEQDYHVTPFAPSPLYGGRPTYVYHAAIRHPDDAGRIIGGIGIVFDAAVEFDAMLRNALGDRQNVHAYFADREGMLLASTDPTRPIGSRLALAPGLQGLANGASGAQICAFDDAYAIIACTAGHGYREFKVSDGYVADVLGVVVESFGSIRDAAPTGNALVLASHAPGQGDVVEYATFFINGELFAILARDVCEALPAARVTPVSLGGCIEQVGMLALEEGHGGDAGRCIWVYDLDAFISGRDSGQDQGAQVIVVKHADRTIGLLVSELHGVVNIDPSQLVATPIAGHRDGMLITDVIKANAGDVLIQVVNTGFLFRMLSNPDELLGMGERAS